MTATNGGFVHESETNAVTAPIVGLVDNPTVSSGITPTIKWDYTTIDEGDPKQFRVCVFESGTRNIIYTSDALALDANEHTLPDDIVIIGEKYTIAVMAEDTIYKEDFGSNNQIAQSRSGMYVEYTPYSQIPGMTDQVYMPMVSVDLNPNDNYGAVFEFDICVNSNDMYFLDPWISIGYDFKVGEGDPLFSSVLLPDIGDGFFDLYYLIDDEWVYQTKIEGGTEYFFGAEGVEMFRISGVEESLGLDPQDATAFVTGIRFNGEGHFTGGMTPILQWDAKPKSMPWIPLLLFND
ncbi:hypothetical protein DSCA_42340 [Desulfosarcina alkanivorans]|uniref:Uncharacterized protein n=1 Tax=Desulfosarcina alkanivorans TaxID=571177 RepID=A0A5K7YVH1_9BACT|nr:hypothetical protein [Desulfosarcina alkanivorans]BBO70304.1 hypothetical protein DSCA_42340 [Desulfosarcina alkanivorans]